MHTPGSVGLLPTFELNSRYHVLLFPDKGICCSFNLAAADEIFIESSYTKILNKIQAQERRSASEPSDLPKWFVDNNEPKPSPGKDRGLVVILDAHSDKLSIGSHHSDFKGFTVTVGSHNSFPFLNQEPFEVRTGSENVVTIRSSMAHADDSLRSLKKEDRKCLLEEEVSDLKIHRKYSYFNCKFECSMFYAQSALREEHNVTCLPWFFPNNNDDNPVICDPWQSFDFYDTMINAVPDEACSHCLPDCSKVSYKIRMSVRPFKTCDLSNLGVSKFCNLQLRRTNPMVQNFVNQLAGIFSDKSNGIPTPAYASKIVANTRTFRLKMDNKDIFKSEASSYNPFMQDIAVLKFVYDKSDVILVTSQARMTWIDYLSNVGGLMGLVLGMGFVSFFEIAWFSVQFLVDWAMERLSTFSKK